MKGKITTITQTPKQSHELGRILGKYLRPGAFIALFGDLGTGKTVVAQGIGQGLGIKRILRSPTFVIAARYPVARQKIRTLYHLDLYRMRNVGTVDLETITEAAADPNGVVIIEWADRLQKTLPRKTIRIRIRILETGERRFDISGLPSRGWKLPGRRPLANVAEASSKPVRTSRRLRRPSAAR